MFNFASASIAMALWGWQYKSLKPRRFRRWANFPGRAGLSPSFMGSTARYLYSLYRGNVANSAERDSKLTKIYLCIKRSDRQHNTKAWFSNALLSLSYTNPSYLLRWETIRCLILVSVFCHIALGPHVRIGTWASGIFHTRFVAQIFWSSGKSGDRESRNCIYMYPFARKIAKGLEP